MTRINSAIPIEALTDEHLLAEHREIKRLPSCYIHRSRNKRIPTEFCLGTGHVFFFFDKFDFTYKRYMLIHKECIKRRFIVTNYRENWKLVKDVNMWNDYIPTNVEKQLLIQRIVERIQLSNKEFFHYYGEKITKEEAINKLKNC